MKIQILGYSGSGKSTLAKELSKIYNIPVLHLDSTKFYGDWQERTEKEQSQIVQKFIDENNDWIIDGTYSKICPERFEMTDATIYLNFNRIKCFISAYKRHKSGGQKESLPCDDKFDSSFIKWLLIDGRTRQRAKKYLLNLNKTKGKKFIFKNRKQVNKFLEDIKNHKIEL